MTEHSEHADLEALSAFVDGEAPEWADHVDRCAVCGATVDSLRAVAEAVGAPVDPPAAAMRELAFTAALAPPEPERARPRRPSIPTRWLIPVAAVMFLFVAGTAALLTMGGRSPSNQTATVAAPDSSANSKSTESGTSGAASDSLALTAPPADLGDVPDAATLLSRARPALSARGASAGAGGATVAPASPGAAAAPAPAIVGTRPCEEQARARQPSLGAVVYFATARRQGVPAVVLGFSTGPDPAQVTLLLLAQDGCGELLRSVGP